MTVKELIEKLLLVPEDAEICTYGEDGFLDEETNTVEYYSDNTVFIGYTDDMTTL